MVPRFEKIIKSFAIDTSGVMLVVILSIAIPSPTRYILMGVAFLAFYFFPYIISNGQTFGKRIEKIKVVDASGRDAGIFRLWARQLVFLALTILSLGIIYPIICFIVMSDKNGNRLPHDFLFRTKQIDLEPPRHGKKDDGFNKTESMRKRGIE